MAIRKVRILEKKIDFGEYNLVVILYNKDSEAKEILENQFDVHFEDGELDEVEEDNTHRVLQGFVKIEDDVVAFCLHNSFTWPDFIHELEHLNWAMLSRSDILLSDATEETYARHIDSMYRIIVEMMKKDKVKLPSI